MVLGGCSLTEPRPAPVPPPDALVNAPEVRPSPTQPVSTPSPVRATMPATTVTSLGNVREPGLWMRTPLVSAPMRGTVRDPVSGRSVALDLIPIEGPPSAGSRMSLRAYQALGLPLTALPDLRVSAGG